MTPREAVIEKMADALWDADNVSTPARWAFVAPEVQAHYRRACGLQLDALLSHLNWTGWQVVPKVATEGMRVVGRDARWRNAVRSADNVGEIFSAMIASAPKFGGFDET